MALSALHEEGCLPQPASFQAVRQTSEGLSKELNTS